MLHRHLRIATAIVCAVAFCVGVVVAFADTPTVAPSAEDAPASQEAREPKRGDLNGDGVLNSADARILWKYLEGEYSLDETQLMLADMSDNGIVNTVDARALWQEMLFGSEAEIVKPTTTTAGSGTATTTGSGHTSGTTTTAVTTTTAAPTTTTTKPTTTTAKPTTTTAKPTAPPSTKPTVQKAPLPTPNTTPPSVSLVQSNVDESVYMKCIRIRAGGVTYDGSTKEGLQLGITAVVKCELGAAKSAMYSTAAWKAQAVVSYTHVARTCYEQVVNNGNTAYCFGVSTSAVNLNDANDRRIYNAVGEVLGQKVMIPSAGGNFAKLCYGFYSASVAGTTASCHKVYVANLPYAQAVYSPETDELVRKYTGQSTAYTRTYTYTVDELVSEVSDYLDEPIYRDTRDDAFSLYTTEWDGGYMYRCNLYYFDRYGNRVYVKGTTLRAALGLRSHGISVIAQSGNTMTLQVTGNGHGVGFSQVGAVIFANEYDWTYDQIIAHYFSITPNSAHQLCLPKW